MVSKLKRIQYGQDGLKTKTPVREAIEYMVPVYGTYKAWKDVVQEPSLGNIAMAGLSTIGDIGTIFGIGQGVNAVVGLNKANKAVNTARKAYEAGHAASATAYARAQTAIADAKKAAQTTYAAGKQGANMSQILNYAKKESAAKAAAKSSIEEAQQAAKVLDGTIWNPTHSWVRGVENGVVTIPGSAYSGGNMYTGLAGNLTKAQAAVEAARTARNYSATALAAVPALQGVRVPLVVANAGSHYGE